MYLSDSIGLFVLRSRLSMYLVYFIYYKSEGDKVRIYGKLFIWQIKYTQSFQGSTKNQVKLSGKLLAIIIILKSGSFYYFDRSVKLFVKIIYLNNIYQEFVFVIRFRKILENIFLMARVRVIVVCYIVFGESRAAIISKTLYILCD